MDEVLRYAFDKNADSLFTHIEQDYLHLKAVARKLPQGLSVLTERKREAYGMYLEDRVLLAFC